MYYLGNPTELIVILIIVLVLFGGKKIPEIMRGLGQGLSEFRRATGHAQEELKSITMDPPPAAPTAPTTAAPAAPAAAPEPATTPTAAPADNSTPPAQPHA